MKHIKLNLIFFILHYSFIICEAQRTKDIYIQVVDTAGLTASVVADTSWILGQLDIVRAELADTSELIQNLIDQQRRLYFAPYYLGQDTLGGIIYHLELDANGEVHGLIACPEIEFDRDTSIFLGDTTVSYKALYTFKSTITEFTMTIEDGQTNTTSLITNAENTAAKYCDTLTYEGYSDWYLPSILELRILSQNIRYVYNSPADINWFQDEEPNIEIYSREFSSSSRDGNTSNNVLTTKLVLGSSQTLFAGYSEKHHVIPIRKF